MTSWDTLCDNVQDVILDKLTIGDLCVLKVVNRSFFKYYEGRVKKERDFHISKATGIFGEDFLCGLLHATQLLKTRNSIMDGSQQANPGKYAVLRGDGTIRQITSFEYHVMSTNRSLAYYSKGHADMSSCLFSALPHGSNWIGVVRNSSLCSGAAPVWFFLVPVPKVRKVSVQLYVNDRQCWPAVFGLILFLIKHQNAVASQSSGAGKMGRPGKQVARPFLVFDLHLLSKGHTTMNGPAKLQELDILLPLSKQVWMGQQLPDGQEPLDVEIIGSCGQVPGTINRNSQTAKSPKKFFSGISSLKRLGALLAGCMVPSCGYGAGLSLRREPLGHLPVSKVFVHDETATKIFLWRHPKRK
eukprot:jgi/Botrbrau1/7912/Bobra.9_2s0080.1